MHERALFRACVVALNAYYAVFREGGVGGVPKWPNRFRVKDVEGARGVWEVTWSFSGSDGRATFEYVQSESGEVAIRWRRIGGHNIFTDP